MLLKQCKKCGVNKPTDQFYVYRKDKLRSNCIECTLTYNKENRSKLVNTLFNRAKREATKEGVTFNLKKEDIQIPDTCPVLGIPLIKNIDETYPTNNTPVLHRTDKFLGFTKTNMRVMSNRASYLLNLATAEEWLKFAKYNEQQKDLVKVFEEGFKQANSFLKN